MNILEIIKIEIMKKASLLLIFVLSISLSELTAQILANKGGNITLSNGSSLHINGDFENLEDGSIDNSGTIYLEGNWTNNAISGNLLQGTTGNVIFNGTSSQTIGGATQTWFQNLNLQADAQLATYTSISGQLHLSAASMILNNSHLMVENTASITGVNGSNYIVADGNGRLIREVGNSNVYFPVGTSSSFVPVMLNNNGVVDNFAVKVFDNILDEGTSGSTIPEIDNCVNMSWDINEQTNGGSVLSITPYWTNSNEGLFFNRTMAGLGHFTNGSWDPQPAQNGSGPIPHSITRTGITTLSTFAVGDINSPLAITLDIVINLAAFLEGPFNATEMSTLLNSNNLLPLSQPYNTGPWNYSGTENVVSLPNADIVDWVLIELRDAVNTGSATPATTISQQAGFVLNDGSIVAIDGISNLQFNATVSQNLFVVVFHRNHLGIISANALTQSGGVYTYDFTTGAYQAFGDNPSQKEIASGIYGMFGGDLNSNGNIGITDKLTWNSETGTSNYTAADANLDGEVDNLDKNDITISNIGEGSYVPE